MRVLVVGAGCTGAAAAVRLREQLPDASISVWEKARGAGGRYTTSRETVNGYELRADMGAQYSSVDPDDADSVQLMESLVKAGAARRAPKKELADTAERRAGYHHYCGTSGQNGIVKAMMSMARAEITFERRVSRLDVRGQRWTASAYDGTSQDFDCVLICVPGCGRGGDNLNKIGGNWQNQLSNADWRRAEVPHDARFAVALFLRPGSARALSAFFGDCVEQKVRSDSIELLIWQSWKNGDPLDGPQVVVAHTGKNVRGDKRSALRPMINETCSMLGISGNNVVSNKIITWYQSQVISELSREPCLVASQSPPLLLAGDYLASSSFTGCVSSGTAAAAEAARLLGASQRRGGPGKRPRETEERTVGGGERDGARTVVLGAAPEGVQSDEAEKRRKRAERFGGGVSDRVVGA